jgi:hypothetical protein
MSYLVINGFALKLRKWADLWVRKLTYGSRLKSTRSASDNRRCSICEQKSRFGWYTISRKVLCDRCGDAELWVRKWVNDETRKRDE